MLLTVAQTLSTLGDVMSVREMVILGLSTRKAIHRLVLVRTRSRGEVLILRIDTYNPEPQRDFEKKISCIQKQNKKKYSESPTSLCPLFHFEIRYSLYFILLNRALQQFRMFPSCQ